MQDACLAASDHDAQRVPGRRARAAVRVALIGIVCALLGVAPGARGAEHESAARVLSAIVGVHAEVPESARTAAGLGTERLGSGVVIDSAGLVVTIGYLILEAERIELVLHDGRRVPASPVGYDSASGFGLVRASEDLGVRPLRLGESARLRAEQGVLVASYGGLRALRPAVVISRREFAGYWEYLLEDAIFTAPPHPAYGGAALLGEHAELLGIGSLAVADAQRGEYLPGNLFVPVDALKSVLGELLANGRPEGPARPWLGLYTDDSGGRLLVTRVARQGPAESAGINPGDEVVAVAGRAVSSMADFYREVWALGDAGVRVPLGLASDAGRREVTVRSADRYEWLRLQPRR